MTVSFDPVGSRDDHEQGDWENFVPLNDDLENNGSKLELDLAGTTTPDDPESAKTQFTFSEGGVPKILLILFICFSGFSLLAVFLSFFVGSVDMAGSHQTAQLGPDSINAQSSEDVDAKDAEIGKLKTQLAFGDTAEEIRKANEIASKQKSLDTDAKIPTKQIPVKKPTSVAPITKIPVRNFRSPLPVNNTFRSGSSTFSTVPTPNKNLPQVDKPVQQNDSMDDWHIANSLGSFGQRSNISSSGSFASSSPNVISGANLGSTNSNRLPTANNPRLQLVANNRPSTELDAQQRAFMRGQAITEVSVGSTSRGVIETSTIMGSGSTQFMVTLREPAPWIIGRRSCRSG